MKVFWIIAVAMTSALAGAWFASATAQAPVIIERIVERPVPVAVAVDRVSLLEPRTVEVIRTVEVPVEVVRDVVREVPVPLLVPGPSVVRYVYMKPKPRKRIARACNC